MRIKILYLWIFAIVLTISHSVAGETRKVPTAWLDLIEAYQEKVSETLKGTIHRRENVHHMVNKKGEIKESDTTFSVVERDWAGNKTVTETDRFGNPLKEKEKDSDEDDGETKTMKVGPLDAFKREQRDQYDFRLLEIDEKGIARISYAPRDADKFKGDGFQAEVTIDTATGAPLRIVGAPIPLPKRMKKMTMDIAYEPLIDSVYVPSRARTKGMAKFLLLVFRFRVEQEFTDYGRVVESKTE